jgi:predicted nucleic acid-binding protein
MQLQQHYAAAIDQLLKRINIVELKPHVLERIQEPFPCAIRTLDAIHLATMHFLMTKKIILHLASYDQRMCDAAKLLNWPIYNL